MLNTLTYIGWDDKKIHETKIWYGDNAKRTYIIRKYYLILRCYRIIHNNETLLDIITS